MRRFKVVVILAVLAVLPAACGARAPGGPSPNLTSSPPSASMPTLTPEPSASASAGPTASPEPTTAAIELAEVELRPAPTRAPADSCPDFDTSSASLDPAMTLAGTEIQFQYQSASPRFGGPGGWSDGVAGPPLRFTLQRAGVVEAAAGGIIRLAPSASTSLTSGQISVYALGPDDHIDESARSGARAEVGGDAAGLDVPLPAAAGHYLLSFYGHWETDCLTGDGYADILLVTN